GALVAGGGARGDAAAELLADETELRPGLPDEGLEPIEVLVEGEEQRSIRARGVGQVHAVEELGVPAVAGEGEVPRADEEPGEVAVEEEGGLGVEDAIG